LACFPSKTHPKQPIIDHFQLENSLFQPFLAQISRLVNLVNKAYTCCNENAHRAFIPQNTLNWLSTIYDQGIFLAVEIQEAHHV
jgi:hypothetical protein